MIRRKRDAHTSPWTRRRVFLTLGHRRPARAPKKAKGGRR
jgi:hypothetical protein